MDIVQIDLQTLRRHDVAGPRYTSYPTAPHFHAAFGESEFRDAVAASNGDPIPRGLSLYVHVPFCESPCFYCGCNRIVTRDKRRGEAYVATLFREIARVAELFDRDREVVQLHFGGGTPNFLAPDQLRTIVATLRGNLRFAPEDACDLSIELDPRHVTPEDIAVLADIGFNRASLGVQDFDPIVQRAVNRVQSVEQTRAVIDACRAHGFRSVNVDLIHGLPKQTIDGFADTLDTVVVLRPDRIAVYAYAHLPAMFRAQTRIRFEDLPDAEGRLSLLQLAIARLTDAGYAYIGMDHFALPGDELAISQARGGLHRNFMGYTTHAESDLVGLGVSAISHVGDTWSQNARDIAQWERALAAGRLPIARGMRLGFDDVLRAELIQSLMCHGVIDIAALEHRHGISFATCFADALERLAPLQADGLVDVGAARIVATPRGRLLLRRIAMCFDRYLHAGASDGRSPQPQTLPRSTQRPQRAEPLGLIRIKAAAACAGETARIDNGDPHER